MFGFKKKQTIAHRYFARIDQGDLDFDAGNLQEIADSAGTLVTDWPNVDLQDLQTFLSRATNDVVRAGDHDLHMQRISYMQTNDKGQAEPTGLSWGNITIDAGFENFVVSTVDHIFNDADVRQDEEMTYDLIVEALENLQSAALDYTDLTQDDMPVFPSEEDYREAQETGEKIIVQPKRFQALAKQFPEQMNQSNNLVDEPAAELKEEVSAGQSNNDWGNPSDLALKEAMVSSSTEKPVIANDTTSQIITTHPAQELIDKIELASPLFVINVGKSVEDPEDKNYVASRLNVEKQQANDFLSDTSNQLTRKIQGTLAKFLKEKHTIFSDQLSAIQTTDIEAVISQKIAGEKTSEFESRYAQRKTARESGYQAEVTNENERHESVLGQLKNNFVADLEVLKSTVTQELDDWYVKRSQILSGDLSKQLEERSHGIQKQYDDSIVAELTQLSAQLLADNSQVIQDMHDKLSQDIDSKRQGFELEHNQAMEQSIKLSSIQNEAKNVGALESQIQTLKAANIDLETRLIDKANKQTDNETLTALKEQLVLLQNQPSNDKANQINDQLMTLLTQQLKPTRVHEESTTNSWKIFSLVALACLIIGCVGVGFYALASHHNDTQVSKSVTSKTASDKPIVVLPQQTTQQTKASSEQSSQASSSSTTTSSSSVSTSNSMSSSFHIGDNVSVTINGQDVTAPVTAVSDQSITVHYDGFDYIVPMS